MEKTCSPDEAGVCSDGQILQPEFFVSLLSSRVEPLAQHFR